MTEQFLPGNPAAFNAQALQRLCDKGGRIVIDVPGVYELDRTISFPPILRWDAYGSYTPTSGAAGSY